MSSRTFDYDDYPYGSRRMLRVLDDLKSRYPSFKATVFAIPAAMSAKYWKPLLKRQDWIKVCPHGWIHSKGECRNPGVYEHRMGMLEYIARDERWTKCFKAPWHGYDERMIRILANNGFSVVLKTLDRISFPTPEFIVAFNPEDKRYANQLKDGIHIESHPIYSGDKRARLKASKTEVSNKNVEKWTTNWSRDDSFVHVHELAEPQLLKLNLGCGRQVWDGWRCLDPRDEIDENRIIKWDFSRFLPWGTNRADVVFTSHVWNYLAETDYVKACLEIWRVLRPGGVYRLSEDATDSGYIWRLPGQSSRGTGEILSLPTKVKVKEALQRVGFRVHDAQPGNTLSPHKDVLQGDSRQRRYEKGHKFYLEAIKDIDIPSYKYVRRYDPRITRQGRCVLNNKKK